MGYLNENKELFKYIIDLVSEKTRLETSYAEISFPTLILPVHNYIGDCFAENAPEILDCYELSPFNMKVQDLNRTLIDKVFAICDYYMNGRIKKHSRHIYDIHKLLPHVTQDNQFRILVQEVRDVRTKTNICPSAQPEINVTELLQKIVSDRIYEEDYNLLTMRLLEDVVPYGEAIRSVKTVADSGMFD